VGADKEKKVKKLTKLVILLVVVAFCLPAGAQDLNNGILVYRKTMKCFEADGEREAEGEWLWETGEERVTGYLILDVSYDEDGQIAEIWGAMQIEYWRDGRDRWYEHLKEWFEVERIEIEDRAGRPVVYWVLENWNRWGLDGLGGMSFTMLRGNARMANIGLGWAAAEKREVPSMLEGCLQYWERWLDEEPTPDMEYIDKSMCCESLRLHPWWTRLANDPDVGDGDFEFAVYEIVVAWLERLGYEEAGLIAE
jgi:hypothetical protein